MSPVARNKNLLEAWIGQKIGNGAETLTREELSRYQLKKIQETICKAYENSPFYHDLLQDFAQIKMSSLEDLQTFPFTTSEHIKEHALQFLCVSQSDISRIVTLDSSGTTGKAKRIYFTPSDQELTIDFFRQGMLAMIKAGDRVLILLPCERSGSVGDLLAKALKRAGAQPISYGIVENIVETIEIMAREKVNIIVGIPVQVLALARYAECSGRNIRLKNVLLSTDHVPNVIIRELGRVWNCQVFEHYGMTEMGLGGGLDCEAHTGYHLREADLYFEIINERGEIVPDGQEGEVVFTTLTRQGMPLIRYRTGDVSRFILEPCSCGTVLKKLARITKRNKDSVYLNEEQYFTIADLDEKIFSLSGVLDYTVHVDDVQLATKLNVAVLMLGKSGQCNDKGRIYETLNKVAVIQKAGRAGRLSIFVKIIYCTDGLLSRPVKRRIMELKEADGK